MKLMTYMYSELNIYIYILNTHFYMILDNDIHYDFGQENSGYHILRIRIHVWINTLMVHFLFS